LSKDLLTTKKELETKYAELAYVGYWFSPLKEALDVFFDHTQQSVSGVVKVRLFKGQAVVVAMKSDSSIYKHNLATYSEGDAFDHKAAVGFIKIWGLPIKTWRQAHPVENASSKPSLKVVGQE